MTETRKKIIELLEPYMDKTLYKGCYFFKNGKLEIITNVLYGDNNKGYYFYKGANKELLEGVKIYGHYDITAVLKYMYEKGYYSNVDKWDKRDKKSLFFITYFDEKIEEQRLGTILNKPLHLYTEQEEKKLFELLKKIGL